MIFILIHFFPQEETESEEKTVRNIKKAEYFYFIKSPSGPSHHINKTKGKRELTSYLETISVPQLLARLHDKIPLTVGNL